MIFNEFYCDFNYGFKIDFNLRIKLNILPPSCSWKYVTIANNIRCYNTRNQPQFEFIRCRTSIRENSISYVGPRTWNSLPLEIQNCFNLGTLARLLRIY